MFAKHLAVVNRSIGVFLALLGLGPILGVSPDLITSFSSWEKCTMGLEPLRSQSPTGIEQDLWTGLMTCNLVRAKMLQSGFAGNREIRSMSFTETYQLLSTSSLHPIQISQPQGEIIPGWNQERLRDEFEKNSQKPDDNAIRT